jgi:tetratricopeptide (TPR) repeat protein
MSLLEGGPRDLAEHQRTIRGALQWSHDLLEPGERMLFRRLSVFDGAFDLAAAEAVCADGELTAGEMLGHLSQLIDKSLVTVDSMAGRDARYRLLETVRQYAAEQLLCSEPLDTVRRRHARHFLALAETARRAEWRSSQAEWASRLEASYPDIRQALQWLRAHDAAGCVRLTTALGWFWMTHGHLNEGREWLLAVREVAPPGSIERAQVLYVLARLAYWQGDSPNARELANQSLALAEELGEADTTRWALALVGSTAVAAGDHAAARAAFDRLLSSGADVGIRVSALIGTGELLLQEGRAAEAREVLMPGLRLASQHDDVWHIGRGNMFLAIAAYLEGDYSRARHCAVEGLQGFARVAHWNGVAAALEGFAALVVIEGDAVLALRLAGAADAIRRRLATPLSGTWQELHESVVLAPARAAAGDRTEQAWAEGTRMSMQEAISCVLAVHHQASASPA